MSDLTPELKGQIDNLNPFQRKYCEFRSRGMSQGSAAREAGSEAEGSGANRVGYQIEQIPGVKEYILHLQTERSKVHNVDEVEIIAKLRNLYEEGLKLGKLGDAVKAVALLGTVAGVFDKTGAKTKIIEGMSEGQSKAVEAFQEEDPDINAEERIQKLRGMLKDLSKVKSD